MLFSKLVLYERIKMPDYCEVDKKNCIGINNDIASLNIISFPLFQETRDEFSSQFSQIYSKLKEIVPLCESITSLPQEAQNLQKTSEEEALNVVENTITYISFLQEIIDVFDKESTCKVCLTDQTDNKPYFKATADYCHSDQQQDTAPLLVTSNEQRAEKNVVNSSNKQHIRDSPISTSGNTYG
ncbi:unnamed protein product [Clavelina lepadiformis]|uniref:BHLH domain-containing protein n=2 Tax=Clavelina lepadiformis TaxID=159417 RepID=A0ABP0H262_CLALP